MSEIKTLNWQTGMSDLQRARDEAVAQDFPYVHITVPLMDHLMMMLRLCTPVSPAANKSGLPTRRCMVCRRDCMKGEYKHRTDPICTSCTQNVREQRQLLVVKYKNQYRARKLAERAAKKATDGASE